jgi:hypothetical protein
MLKGDYSVTRKQHLLEFFFMFIAVSITLFISNSDSPSINLAFMALYAVGGTLAGYGFRFIVLSNWNEETN